MTVLGQAAHQILREAAQNANSNFHPEQRWDEVVQTINEKLRQSWVEAVLYPLQSTAPMYQVLKRRTCIRATEILSTARGGGKTTRMGRRSTGYEVWVESRDGKVAGSIDKAENIDGEIVLSDFKTGSIANAVGKNRESDVKEGYAVQLKMYAALYHQTFDLWPTQLRIVPLSGAARDIEFTQGECMELVADAALTLESLNRKIENEAHAVLDIASPSPETCRFCTFRPVCKAYRERSTDAHQMWPPDVLGKVWDINILRSGGMNLHVATGERNQVILRALPSQRHPALKAIQRGDQVGLFNARASAGRKEYADGPLTILYKYENSFFAT